MATIGDRIRDARKRANLAQAALADAVGVRPQTMWRYEKEGVEPGAVVTVNIAKQTGVTAEWLVLGEESGAASPLTEIPESYKQWRKMGPENLDPDVESRMLGFGLRFEDAFRWGQLYDLVLADVARKHVSAFRAAHRGGR